MDIHWRINAYDTDNELDGKGSIGVCHDVPINLDGVRLNNMYCGGTFQHGSHPGMILGKGATSEFCQ
jgi:hypothetical protein